MRTKQRFLSLLLCGTLFFFCSSPAYAEAQMQDNGQPPVAGGLCEHHTEHGGECGYTGGEPGTPCTHEHTKDCYAEITECVHEHTAECYVEEAADSVSGSTATPSGAKEREPENCPHVCSEESGCVTKELNCQHKHDSECGYSPAAGGTPCGFICEICGAEDASPSNTAAITADQVLENGLQDKTTDHERPEDLAGVWSDKAPFLMEAEEEDDLSSQPFGIIKASKICPTYEEAYNAMIGMKDELYEGMPWTNFQPYGNEGEWGKYYRFQGGTVKGASLGVGCAAFVFILSDEAFGTLPARTVDRGVFEYEDVKVGDILRINNSHFVIVLRVGPGGVTVAEGNYNKSVHWGRVMSKSEVLNANFIVTRYPAGYSEEQDAEDILQSGTEGSLNWTLTKGGTLSISGKGAMPDYTESSRPDWETHAAVINQVMIEDGVESIGSYAFYQSPVMSVQIPETVTSIGKAAFGKSSLTEITVPGSVKIIGDEAFYDCQGLKSATFYEGVQSIGVNAFHKCGIAYLDFPASITSVGAGAFMECDRLVQVRFAPGEQRVSLGDNLFSKCWYLLDVTLPLKADKISSGMFTNCMALTYLYIPEAVEIDGMGLSGSPFAGCGILQTIDFGGTESEWQTNGGRSALTYAGLINQVTVNYNAAFDDPFAEIPGDPGEFVTCEHVDKDGDGRCDICDAVLSTDPSEPGEPEEPGDDKEEPGKPEEPGDDKEEPGKPDDSEEDDKDPVKPGDGESEDEGSDNEPDDDQNPGDSGDDGDTSGGNSGGSSGGWEDSSTPTYGSDTFSNGGVTLSGSGIHKNARLTVTPNNLHNGECAECGQIRQWQEQGRVVAIYDVSLSHSFRGTVTLTFPISSEYNGKTLTVAHCLKDKLDSYDVAVSNGKIKVTADSLSPFAILDNSKDEPGKDTPNTGTGNPFTDVKETDWFYKDMMFAYENGLMAGKSAATFAPSSNATRAQLAVIFYRTEGSPKVEGKNSFTDVVYGPGTAWYYDAVTWAEQSGVVGGYGDGRFGPGNPITREQLAAFFYRYAQYKGYDMTATGSLDRFTDKDKVSQWSKQPLIWAVSSGIVNGTGDNLLSPKGTATRAHIAAMLHRFISNGFQPAATPSGTI